MCGRYFFQLEEEPAFKKLKQKVDQLALYEYAQEEVFPSNRVIVLISDKNKDYTLALMKWGISGYQGNLLINARSEHIEEKKTFQPMLSNRCLIPCNGFYEWMGKGKQKQKVYIQKEKEPLLYMAGIYNEQKEFVIVTGASQHEMQEVHGRTPIFIGEGKIVPYLSNECSFEGDPQHFIFTKQETNKEVEEWNLFTFDKGDVT